MVFLVRLFFAFLSLLVEQYVQNCILPVRIHCICLLIGGLAIGNYCNCFGGEIGEKHVPILCTDGRGGSFVCKARTLRFLQRVCARPSHLAAAFPNALERLGKPLHTICLACSPFQRPEGFLLFACVASCVPSAHFFFHESCSSTAEIWYEAWQLHA